MRFMIGVIIAGVLVVAMNVVLIRVAFDVDGSDTVVPSYEKAER